jgi:ribosomal protein S18 acetylase RimI-like enzyme
MTTSLHIRAADVNDIATIREMANITWPVAYGSYISKAQLDYMLDMMYSDTSLLEQINKGHQFYIAEQHNTPINKLYVLPTAQKTGAGKALLHTAIDYAISNTASCLYLQVNKQNNAQHFYSKHGFTVREASILEIGGGYIMDDYIMELVFKG